MISVGDTINVKHDRGASWSGPYECIDVTTMLLGGEYSGPDGTTITSPMLNQIMVTFTDHSCNEYGELRPPMQTLMQHCKKVKPEFKRGDIVTTKEGDFTFRVIDVITGQYSLLTYLPVGGSNSIYADHCRHATAHEKEEFLIGVIQSKMSPIIPSGPFNFAVAWTLLLEGNNLSRPVKIKSLQIVHPHGEEEITTPYMLCRTHDGECSPWSPTQEDIFAEDWELSN